MSDGLTNEQRAMLRRIDQYEKAKDQLLLSMADGIGICLTLLKESWPHSEAPEKMIHRLSSAMDHFRKALDNPG